MELEQLRILVDEVRVNVSIEELLVFQHVQEERDVRFHSTNSELTESAIHLRAR